MLKSKDLLVPVLAAVIDLAGCVNNGARAPLKSPEPCPKNMREVTTIIYGMGGEVSACLEDEITSVEVLEDSCTQNGERLVIAHAKNKPSLWRCSK